MRYGRQDIKTCLPRARIQRFVFYGKLRQLKSDALFLGKVIRGLFDEILYNFDFRYDDSLLTSVLFHSFTNQFEYIHNPQNADDLRAFGNKKGLMMTNNETMQRLA